VPASFTIPVDEDKPVERRGQLLRIFVGENVMNLPEPDWLLRDFIQEGGLTIIHGDPGSGKSLVMMDWANVLSAHGGEWKWAGRERKERTPALYIMGEGIGGLKGRILAWQQERHLEYTPDVHYVLQPVDLRKHGGQRSPEQEELLEYVVANGITAVFIDTLAATFGAGNENMQQDMNEYLQTLWDFQEAGAAVIVAHHDAKGTKDLRGSSVLKGAADTVVQMEGDFGDAGLNMTTMYLRKQKDGMPFSPIQLKPIQHSVDTKHESSVVLKYDGVLDVRRTLQEDLLSYISGSPGQTWSAIRKAVPGSNDAKPVQRDILASEGKIEKRDHGWYVVADAQEAGKL
jgi:hypothetical protein